MKLFLDKVIIKNNVCKMLSKWDLIYDYNYWKYGYECIR